MNTSLHTPRPDNEDPRMQKLREYQILDSPSEQIYDDIISLAAQICATPFALLILVDGEREWFKAKKGINADEHIQGGGFGTHTILLKHELVVSDLRNDTRFSTHTFVTSEPHVRFYAGVPICAPSGEALGALCVLDTIPRGITTEQIEALKMLAHQTLITLELRRKDLLLTHTLAETIRIEHLLHNSWDAQKSILNSANVSIISTYEQGIIASFNRAAQNMLGYSEAEVVGKFTPILFHDANEINTQAEKLSKELGYSIVPGFEALVAKTRTGKTDEREWTYLKKDGGRFPAIVSVTTLCDDNEAIIGYLFISTDNTTHRHVENLLRESEERFQSAFDLAAIGMALVDIDGKFLQVNSSLCNIFGYSEQELLEANLKILSHDDVYQTTLGCCLQQLLADEVPSFQIEMESRHKIVGKVVWTLLSASLVRDIAANEPQYFIIQIQDITDRKHAEQKLVYIANYDPLTGLLNRGQFHDRFTQILALIRRQNTKLALMYIDLENFKSINDTFGHRLGDLLLQAISIRLKNSTRVNDTIARLCGDEFIVLMSDINLIDDVARIAQKTIEMLTQPFSLEGNEIMINVSVGISVYPDDGKNSHLLLTNADTAMYLAKERGKNNYQFFTMEMTTRSLERMAIENSLRHALTHHELKLHYQPQIDAMNGRAVSAEALLRWQHPDLGLIYPDNFIAVAEETGLIIPIGSWVLRTACVQAKAWHDNDGPFTRVAVNLSNRQFLEKDLFKTIKEVLTDTGLNPSSLEIEITESAIMQDPENAYQVLQQLHDLGVLISIDGFGMGYSHLTYLQRFPIHSVKIDRSFITDIPNNAESMLLVRAIIMLTHELNLKVIAQGVETEEQLAFLKENKCDMLQGNLFSHPDADRELDIDFRSLLKPEMPTFSN